MRDGNGERLRPGKGELKRDFIVTGINRQGFANRHVRHGVSRQVDHMLRGRFLPRVNILFGFECNHGMQLAHIAYPFYTSQVVLLTKLINFT